jgi:3-methyladenine DNA glycosylase AlkD
MSKITAQIQQALRDQADPVKADFFPRFFKSEPGDKDQFLGVTVPKQRLIVKAYSQQITPEEVQNLLHSEIHEERLTALMIWVAQFKQADAARQQEIYELYLNNTTWVNNWDLVDSSARDIVGGYLFDKDQAILDKLSKSKNVWERRIAIIATFYFLKRGEFAWTLKLAERYLKDQHHYIHKATGWMLREVGKQDRQVLLDFLDTHAAAMPRTALRYAIEHLDSATRANYLARR